jgi:hypothetical protein
LFANYANITLKKMKHRHVNNEKEWSKVAIHSVLERGSDKDILELKNLVMHNKKIALLVYDCCQYSEVYALPWLFMEMIEDLYGKKQN